MGVLGERKVAEAVLLGDDAEELLTCQQVGSARRYKRFLTASTWTSVLLRVYSVSRN